LGSVERALSPRCDYSPGNIHPADLAHSGLQECTLMTATRDPRLWRALPELLAQGAKVDSCPVSPLVTLAEAEPCPDFTKATPAILGSITFMAESDPRAVRHDVFRMLGCSKAREAGLDHVLITWLDRGDLQPGKLSFSPLDAADPALLVSRFGHELEVAGHTPEAALDGYEGVLPSGFEEALRTSNWAALDWWLYRLPQLANLVPPTRGGLLGWVPLQRVLLPGFLQDPASQRNMVAFLMARGADPKQKLPFDDSKTVIAFAAQMKSPMLALLDAPAVPATEPVVAFAKATAPSTPTDGSVQAAVTRHATRSEAKAQDTLAATAH
jgi:hypothetical protein